jgi:hypothetical protein
MRGVYLVGNPRQVKVFHAGDGLIKGAGTAKDIVGSGIGPVKTDAHPPYSGFFDLASHMFVNQRAVGGQGHDETGVGRAPGDVKDVRPEEGFSAGKDEY